MAMVVAATNVNPQRPSVARGTLRVLIPMSMLKNVAMPRAAGPMCLRKSSPGRSDFASLANVALQHLATESLTNVQKVAASRGKSDRFVRRCLQFTTSKLAHK